MQPPDDRDTLPPESEDMSDPVVPTPPKLGDDDLLVGCLELMQEVAARLVECERAMLLVNRNLTLIISQHRVTTTKLAQLDDRVTRLEQAAARKTTGAGA